MSGIIGWLAGAPQAASTAGGYYQTAANQLATEYGSPAAQMFSKEYMGAMQPQMEQLNQQGLGQLAATGLGGSGAGRATMGDITAQEAGSLASGVAPMYQQALQQYGNIIGAMPGAQEGAYQGAVQDFYGALQSGAAAAAGVPSMPSSGMGYSYGGPNGSFFDSYAANPQLFSAMNAMNANPAIGTETGAATSPSGYYGGGTSPTTGAYPYPFSGSAAGGG